MRITIKGIKWKQAGAGERKREKAREQDKPTLIFL